MKAKEIVNNFFEWGYNQKDFAKTKKLLAKNYIDNSPANARSDSDAINILKIVANTYPDLTVKTLELIQEDNMVAGRFLFTATINGSVKQWEALENFKIEDEKIIESWGYWPEI